MEVAWRLPVRSLSLTQRPEQQLGAALAAGFGQQARHMTFDRAPAEN